MNELINQKLDFSVEEMDRRFLKGKVNLGPNYQRYDVWTLTQKRQLIDSIIRGFDIPKIYFREVDGSFEIVDGQQRLRAIFDFLNQEKTFRLDNKAKCFNGKKIAGCSLRDLPLDVFERINAYSLTMIKLINYSDEQIADFYVRLQMGTRLNSAECRRGIISNMRDMAFEFSKHPFFSLLDSGNKRQQYEDFVGKFFHLLKHNTISAPTKDKVDLDWLKNKKINYKEDDTCKSMKKILDFIFDFAKESDFIGDNKFKFSSYFALSFCLVIDELLSNTNIKKYTKNLSDCIENLLADIEIARSNMEKGKIPPNEMLVKYISNARRDSISAIKSRCESIKFFVERDLPDLKIKDTSRYFSTAQRYKIYKNDSGRCKKCGVKCSPDGFHADHIIPYSKGGPTIIENGQVLCPKCNLEKGDKEDVGFLKYHTAGV